MYCHIFKDISNTRDVIQIVEEKLKHCDENLNLLKKNAFELNKDFNNISEKVNDLNKAMQKPTQVEDDLHITRILSTLETTDDDYHFNEVQRRLSMQSVNDLASEIASTYASSSSSSSSSESSEDDDEYRLSQDILLNEKCNKLINMLINSSHSY